MSIQNRLLFIYAAIFSVTFVLVAVIVYLLPRNRVLAEIDASLEALAAEVRPENTDLAPDGVFRINIPENLANFETASTFMVIIDSQGDIVARSSNLSTFDDYLDEDALTGQKQINLVRHDEALLRVLTVPLVIVGETGNAVPVAHLQIGRLLDSYESFNRVLVIALSFGFVAAFASLFLAVLLTPSLFKPLEDIARVAQQITRADDLSRRVPDTGRTDEIGDLTRSINQTLERLERLFRAQQRLLADVSHELRTPLTSVRGNLDLMRHMGEYEPELIQIVQEEVQRMTRLVGDLLLLARADAGGLPIEQHPIELDNLLFEVYRRVRVLPKGVDIRLTDIDQVAVKGDEDRLKQLFINLVENAIKYTPEGGRIDLSLSKSDGAACVKISDTGVGIPPEDLPHIFDRFYRVDKARTRSRQGGSGLGLSIAKWITQAHGGDLQATSEVGVGTTFTVLLPVMAPKRSPEELVEEELERLRPSLRLMGNGRQRGTEE